MKERRGWWALKKVHCENNVHSMTKMVCNGNGTITASEQTIWKTSAPSAHTHTPMQTKSLTACNFVPGTESIVYWTLILLFILFPLVSFFFSLLFTCCILCYCFIFRCYPFFSAIRFFALQQSRTQKDNCVHCSNAPLILYLNALWSLVSAQCTSENATEHQPASRTAVQSYRHRTIVCEHNSTRPTSK